MRNILTPIIIVIMLIALIGCEKGKTSDVNIGSSTHPEVKNVYLAKKQLLEKVSSNSSLSMIMSILINDWPKLFMLKNEMDLFDTYANITWNVESNDKKKLESQLSNHQYYNEYLKLYQEGILPAKSYSVKEINAQQVFSTDSNDKGHAIISDYELILNDDNKMNLTVELTVNENLELFNSNFNVDKGQNHTLPQLNDEGLEAKRDFMVYLIGWRQNNLTFDELLDLINK